MFANVQPIRKHLLNCRLSLFLYKVFQIWAGQTMTCLHTISPGHIWTTLYLSLARISQACPWHHRPTTWRHGNACTFKNFHLQFKFKNILGHFRLSIAIKYIKIINCLRYSTRVLAHIHGSRNKPWTCYSNKQHGNSKIPNTLEHVVWKTV
jgi:hypothetical protein